MKVGQGHLLPSSNWEASSLFHTLGGGGTIKAEEMKKMPRNAEKTEHGTQDRFTKRRMASVSEEGRPGRLPIAITRVDATNLKPLYDNVLIGYYLEKKMKRADAEDGHAALLKEFFPLGGYLQKAETFQKQAEIGSCHSVNSQKIADALESSQYLSLPPPLSFSGQELLRDYPTPKKRHFMEVTRLPIKGDGSWSARSSRSTTPARQTHFTRRTKSELALDRELSEAQSAGLPGAGVTTHGQGVTDVLEDALGLGPSPVGRESSSAMFSAGATSAGSGLDSTGGDTPRAFLEHEGIQPRQRHSLDSSGVAVAAQALYTSQKQPLSTSVNSTSAISKSTSQKDVVVEQDLLQDVDGRRGQLVEDDQPLQDVDGRRGQLVDPSAKKEDDDDGEDEATSSSWGDVEYASTSTTGPSENEGDLHDEDDKSQRKNAVGLTGGGDERNSNTTKTTTRTRTNTTSISRTTGRTDSKNGTTSVDVVESASQQQGQDKALLMESIHQQEDEPVEQEQDKLRREDSGAIITSPENSTSPGVEVDVLKVDVLNTTTPPTSNSSDTTSTPKPNAPPTTEAEDTPGSSSTSPSRVSKNFLEDEMDEDDHDRHDQDGLPSKDVDSFLQQEDEVVVNEQEKKLVNDQDQVEAMVMETKATAPEASAFFSILGLVGGEDNLAGEKSQEGNDHQLEKGEGQQEDFVDPDFYYGMDYVFV
ncbi:unnamed protein product [Amoebophrya sp. A25]|nr:unnamed protein product [Amoebophrya sp. A25]|eukprot:GSA25T00008567001.1